MALENPALNEHSFRRGIEEAGAEPRGMSASGTYAIAGLLLAIVVAAAAFGWSQVEIVTGAFQRLALLALALIAWALADQIGGNGFIAAFVGGLAVEASTRRGSASTLAQNSE